MKSNVNQFTSCNLDLICNTTMYIVHVVVLLKSVELLLGVSPINVLTGVDCTKTYVLPLNIRYVSVSGGLKAITITSG